MGNQSTFEQHTYLKNVNTKYEYEKKLNDIRFGEIKLLKDKETNKKVFQKDSTSNNSKDLQSYIKEIKEGSKFSHSNLLKILGYNSIKEDFLCADFFKVSLFFEGFENDLEQEIRSRERKKDYFPETELWFILDSIASACAYLQRFKIRHRDIRPYNILVTADKDYKIALTSLFNKNQDTEYLERIDRLENKYVYYSPETFSQTQQPFYTEEYISDVFSLGMTLLEAANLKKLKNVYDFKTKKVNSEPIKQALESLKSRYSENFIKTIESCLDFNPSSRLDFIRLDKELGIYRKDIKENARGGVGTGEPLYSPREVITDEKAFDFAKASPVVEHLQSSPPHEDNFSYEEDLERRVREAVKRSEEMIRQNSPNRYSQQNLEPYVKYYLEPNQNKDMPIINTIPPNTNNLNTRDLSFNPAGYSLTGSASQKWLRPDRVDVPKSNSFAEPSSANFRENYLYTQSGGGSEQAVSGVLQEDYSQPIGSFRQATLYSKPTPRHTGTGSTQGTNRQTYASIGDTYMMPHAVQKG